MQDKLRIKKKLKTTSQSIWQGTEHYLYNEFSNYFIVVNIFPADSAD